MNNAVFCSFLFLHWDIPLDGPVPLPAPCAGCILGPCLATAHYHNVSPHDAHLDCLKTFTLTGLLKWISLNTNIFVHVCYSIKRINSYTWNCWGQRHVQFIFKVTTFQQLIPVPFPKTVSESVFPHMPINPGHSMQSLSTQSVGESDFTAKTCISNSERGSCKASGCSYLSFLRPVHPMDPPGEFTSDPGPSLGPGSDQMPNGPCQVDRGLNGGLSTTEGRIKTQTL